MSRRFSKKGHSDDSRHALRDELQLLGQVASTESALFHERAAEHFGMGITDAKAVTALMQAGPMTAGQLASRLSLTTGAVTNLIDRLENKHLVQRVKDPNDRRKVIVRINGKSLRQAENIYQSIGETFDKLAKNYTTGELEFLVEYYKQSIELTKAEIAKLAKKP